MIAIPDFSGLRVLVVGDVMLDRYWHGDVTRISQEAPVPVVAVNRVEERAGGAANVALNCAALGATVWVVSVVGDDDAGQELNALLGQTPRVVPLLGIDPGIQTTVKLRVVGQRQQMIRLDFEDMEPSSWHTARMAEYFNDLVDGCDIVIASDYAKGALRNVQSLIQSATAAGKPIFVDPKGEDWSKYAGSTLIKPNAFEWAMLRDQDAQMYVSQWTLLTRGKDGMTLKAPGMEDQHQRAYAREVYDVTGAGDTVMAVMACMHAAGRPWAEAMHIASKAAAIVVGRLGTAAVTREELLNA